MTENIKEKNIAVTEEDSVMEAPANELSDDALDAVAGGVGDTCMCDHHSDCSTIDACDHQHHHQHGHQHNHQH